MAPHRPATTLLVAVLLVSCVSMMLASTAVHAKATVLLQAFDWAAISGNKATLYSQIASKASAMASAGVTDVWFPPPSQSADAQGCVRPLSVSLECC